MKLKIYSKLKILKINEISKRRGMMMVRVGRGSRKARRVFVFKSVNFAFCGSCYLCLYIDSRSFQFNSKHIY